MKLSVKALALASGILWGASVFLATLWLLMRGYDGRLITQLNHFYRRILSWKRRGGGLDSQF